MSSANNQAQGPGYNNLSGKVAIVSGSSQGIGAATVQELSARGATVVVNYPSPAWIAGAQKVHSSLPSPGILVEADLSTIDGPKRLVAETIKKLGRLDILINNAGVISSAPLEDQTLEEWDRLVNVNGRGVFLLTQAAVKYMTRGSGRIVNIISSSSRYPGPGQTIYAGTKGMVESFTRCWAKELPPVYGCTVNAVSPGPTLTEGLSEARGALKEISTYLNSTSSQTPVAQRAGAPSEIAYAVAMFCEEQARWINGTHVIVSGGLFTD
jgi:NAD(P)-dependent dehydrogenase (short-subunit alcohol dehydrogenase family)